MTLSAALVELVHHVALNDTGWWQGACQKAALGVLWLADRPLTPRELHHDLTEVGLDLDPLRCEHLLRQLAGEDVTETAGAYTLTESGRVRIEAHVEEGRAVEARVRERFERSLHQHLSAPVDVDRAWAAFNETLLLPMVRRLGARTYELLRGNAFRLDPATYLDPYLSRYGEVDRSELRAAIGAFLDPRASAVRDYVLRHLTASFVLRAAALDEVVLKELREAVEEPAEFVCLLDTNVLFSVLDLHDHPANDAVQNLLEVVASHRDRVRISFRVLPITLEEARSALVKAQDACRGIVLGANLLAAASQVRFHGLVARFVQQARAGGERDPQRYFDEIVANLLTLCRNRGVELHNDGADAYKVREDVATDIVELLEFERGRSTRPKSYEQVEHDLVLWHFTRDLRPRYVESPLAARYWVATVDYRFAGFDAWRSRGQRSVPVCLDPAALLALLQFWVPRSETMERAFVASLRVAFLFQEFDQHAEDAVVKVLRALSRFEGAAGLSEDTVARMLLNGDLRRRLSLTDDRDREMALVRDELIDNERRLRRQLTAAEEEAARAREASREAAGERDAAVAAAAAARAEARAMEEQLRRLAARREAGRAAAGQRRRAAERRSVRAFLAGCGVVGGLLVLGVVLGAGALLDRGRVTAGLVVGLVVAAAWLALARRRLERASAEVRAAYRWLAPWSAALRAAAVAVATGVLASAVYAELVAR